MRSDKRTICMSSVAPAQHLFLAIISTATGHRWMPGGWSQFWRKLHGLFWFPPCLAMQNRNAI
jgi:hypothetical protein